MNVDLLVDVAGLLCALGVVVLCLAAIERVVR